jgi:type IV fimbrial biogenesis protein FimT
MNRKPVHPHNAAPTLQAGYTLTELLVVVAIVGIMTAAAVPNFTQMMQKQKVDSQVSALVSAMRSARAEAVKRGQQVTLCATNNPNDNLPVCAIGNPDWSRGWVVFVDNGPNLRTLDPGETIVSVQQAFDGSGVITNAAWSSMVFLPSGLPMGGVQSTFVVRPSGSGADTSPLVRNIVLSAPGRVRIDKPFVP